MDYLKTAQGVINVISIIDTLVLVGVLLWGGALWLIGIFPVLLRLGNGLAKRKIALFAGEENARSLEDLMLDSSLFKKRNITVITKAEDIGRAEDSSVYLVYWPDWAENINMILEKKPDPCALVVYAPYDKGRIPDEVMKMLDGKRHTAVTNFRGRLLNDMLTSMMTTAYGRQR